MIYYKDLIRYWINKILKVDKDYLIRIKILNQLEEFETTPKNNYSFNYGGHKMQLRNLSSDFNVFHQVLIEEEYSFAKDLYQKYFGTEPRNLLDIGANIGLTSIYFSSAYPNINIIAVEAEESNFTQLKSNTASYSNINPVKAAIWNSKTTLKIGDNFRDGRSWAFQVNTQNGFQEVEAMTLQDLTEKFSIEHVDILKIDIEGAEKQVILEDKTIDKVLSNTKLVCVEIHDSIVSRIEITQKFRDAGFDTFSKGETLFAVKK
jgi:FkbM family methyltransferase